MANEQNLEATKFKKGDKRASEAGKKSKRGPSIVAALKKKLKESPDVEKTIMDALILHATDGSPAHMKMILEYIDGKVPDKVEMKSSVKEDVKVIFND